MEELIRLYLFKRNDYDGLKDFIKSQLPDYDFTEDEYGNMYGICPKSDSKACIAAHLDQVPAGDIAKVVEYNGFLFGEDKDGYPANLGADDKNGIWIALKAGQHKTKPRLVFFLDEETGRQGSKQCDEEFMSSVAFTIVVDRKGSKQIIYSGANRLYGTLVHILFKSANPDWEYEVGVSCDADSIRKYCDCINISCGYYKAHTKLEYTCIKDLKETWRAVDSFLDERCDKFPVFDWVNDFRQEVFCGDDICTQGVSYGKR